MNQHGLISQDFMQKMQVAQEHIQFDAIYIKVNSKKNYILFKDIYIQLSLFPWHLRGGFGAGPPQIPKSPDAQVPYIKWQSTVGPWYLRILYPRTPPTTDQYGRLTTFKLLRKVTQGPKLRGKG